MVRAAFHRLVGDYNSLRRTNAALVVSTVTLCTVLLVTAYGGFSVLVSDCADIQAPNINCSLLEGLNVSYDVERGVTACGAPTTYVSAAYVVGGAPPGLNQTELAACLASLLGETGLLPCPWNCSGGWSDLDDANETACHAESRCATTGENKKSKTSASASCSSSAGDDDDDEYWEEPVDETGAARRYPLKYGANNQKDAVVAHLRTRGHVGPRASGCCPYAEGAPWMQAQHGALEVVLQRLEDEKDNCLSVAQQAAAARSAQRVRASGLAAFDADCSATELCTWLSEIDFGGMIDDLQEQGWPKMTAPELLRIVRGHMYKERRFKGFPDAPVYNYQACAYGVAQREMATSQNWITRKSLRATLDRSRTMNQVNFDFTRGRAFLISRSVGPRPPPQRARAPYVENKNKTLFCLPGPSGAPTEGGGEPAQASRKVDPSQSP